MTASGSTLQKTSGCGGCADASAVSQQQLAAASGSFQFSAADTGTLRFIGLSVGSIGTTAGDLSFALRLQNGTVEVRESGAYKSEASFGAGDTLGIRVENGTVKYLKNGAVFYTSGSRAPDAQRVHAVFFDSNATVANFTIGSSTAGASSAGAAAASSALSIQGTRTRPPSAEIVGYAVGH